MAVAVRDKHLKAAEAPEGQESTFYSQPVITHTQRPAAGQSAACNCFPAVETQTCDASSHRHKKFVVRQLQVQQWVGLSCNRRRGGSSWDISSVGHFHSDTHTVSCACSSPSLDLPALDWGPVGLALRLLTHPGFRGWAKREEKVEISREERREEEKKVQKSESCVVYRLHHLMPQKKIQIINTVFKFHTVYFYW